jgi:hypothetical protein
MAIKGLPMIPKYDRNVVRTYCLTEGKECIKDKNSEVIVRGKDLVQQVLDGDLDLVK